MPPRTQQSLNTVTPEGETLFPGMPAASIPTPVDSEATAVDNLLTELGGISEDGAKVMVYRANAQNGRKVEAFLYECLPQEFSLTDLGARYGSGEYRVRGYRYRDGKRTLFVNQSVCVETSAPASATPAPVITQAAPDVTNLVAPLISAMTTGFQELGRLIVNSAPKQASRQEWLQELAMMRQIFGESNKGLDPSQIMTLITQGIEIGKGQTPPEDMEGAMMLETVKQIGPLLSGMAQRNPEAAPRPMLAPAPLSPLSPAIPSPQVPGSAHVVASPSSPVTMTAPAMPQSPDGQDMRPMISYAVNMLVAQAARGADPELYAEVVADQIPPETIAELLERPDWFDLLAGFNPKVREHQAWFVSLADALRALLTDDPQSDSDIGDASTTG